jgi:hypothetical protein
MVSRKEGRLSSPLPDSSTWEIGASHARDRRVLAKQIASIAVAHEHRAKGLVDRMLGISILSFCLKRQGCEPAPTQDRGE